MKTLQEKYNAIQEGAYTKAQFVRDSRMELPNTISQVNSYQDTVAILKNKGIVSENKKEDKVTEYEKPHPGVPLEAFERAVDYELEAAGIDTATSAPTQEEYQKAAKKANKNLDKDPNHYLHLMSGDSKKVDKHDQLKQYKDKDKVDTINGLKKADLKESYEDEDFERLSREIEYNISAERDNYQDETDLEEEETPVDQRISADKLLKIAKLANQIVPDASDELKNLIVFYGEKIPKHRVKRILNNYDLSQIKLREAMKGETTTKSSELGNRYLVDMGDGSKEELTVSKRFTLNPPKGEKEPGFYSKEYGDQMAFLDSMIIKPINEGRRKKIKGGKAIKENDYDSGGYVEMMQPRLDDAIDKVLKVWDQWKNGPATEPGMIPHAERDLIDYFTDKLSQKLEEDEKADKDYDGDGEIESPEEEYLGSKDAAIKSNMDEEGLQQLKEVFKKKIVNILKQNNQPINEAKTENLEEFLHYENENNEDLAARIRKAAAELEDIIGSLEKSHIDIRQKVENIYKQVGSFMAPAVAAAFKRDLIPVLKKLHNIEVPKGKRISKEEMKQLGIDSTDTTGTAFSLKESKKARKTKYTKRK